jgi:hypothetical protein
VLDPDVGDRLVCGFAWLELDLQGGKQALQERTTVSWSDCVGPRRVWGGPDSPFVLSPSGGCAGLRVSAPLFQGSGHQHFANHDLIDSYFWLITLKSPLSTRHSQPA